MLTDIITVVLCVGAITLLLVVARLIPKDEDPDE